MGAQMSKKCYWRKHPEILGVIIAGLLISGQTLRTEAASAQGLRAEAASEMENLCGYVEVPYTIHSIEEGAQEIAILGEAELPEAYDAREHGKVTSVKRQNPWGNCWSFAAISALESSLISDGYDANIDLSEYHMNYYCYQSVTDPLNGTAGDGFTYGGTLENFLEAGGNILVSFHALANWVGAVEEEVTGYPTSDPEALEGTVENAYLNDAVHLQQMYQLSKEDRDAVKKEIMEHGSLTASFYYTANYYNASTGGYYNNKNTNANHAVAVVGWDDNFSKVNFKTKPASDGAWLVKNSWGTSFGQEGYLWISYEDTSIGDAMCLLLAEGADNYDNNYQYDGSYMSTKLKAQEKMMLSNIFQVQEGDTKEALRAVAFELGNTNVEYSIQIYRNLRQAGNPLSGTPMLEKPVTGSTLYQGYYTVELPEAVELNPGECFSVVITCQQDEYVYAVLEKSTVWNKIEFVASAEDNQSLLSTDGGKTWLDVGKKYKGNLRVKAFTDNTDMEPDKIVLPFLDVIPSDWQYPAVLNMYELNIMVGKTAELFGTNDMLSRSEFVTVLYNYAGCPEPEEMTCPFGDVETGTWYESPIIWAAQENITAGYGDTFGVKDVITREQFVTMLYEYAKSLGIVETASVGALDAFADADRISDWAEEAMLWALQEEVIVGKPDENGGLLADPKGGTTRGECAAIMMEFIELQK